MKNIALCIIMLFLIILNAKFTIEKDYKNNKISLSINDKLDDKDVSVKETIKEEKELNERVSNLEDNYNIIIKIKYDAFIEFPDFSAEIEKDNNIIIESLNKIETILKKYNKEFFLSFYDKNYNGLNIYLTSTLTPSNYEKQISNPAAYSLVYKDEYIIVIDINQSNIEKLLCHELMHNIEFNLKEKGINAFSKWDELNPKEFYYNDSYTMNYIFNYTLEETKIDNIYFVDKYSHTYSSEDRARIFENICAFENNSLIKNYPNLYSKGLYLKEEIINYYPSLFDSTIFGSLT